MGRRRVLWVAALVTAGAVLAVMLVWRPWDPVPDELRRATAEVADVPGVVDVDLSYEVTMRDAKDGDAAIARLTVRLDDALSPDAAAESARAAGRLFSAVDVPRLRSLDRSVRITAGEPTSVDGVELSPLEVHLPPEDDGGLVADAFTLRGAGAVTVRGGTAEARDGGALVDLAGFAAQHGIPASLATVDGTVRYDSYGGVPDVAAVRLAVEAAGRDGSASAIYADSTEPHLQVSTTTPADSPETRALTTWLDAHDAATAVGHPVAYRVAEPGYATIIEGWVSGTAPAEPERLPNPVPDVAEPWPADEGAPSCAGDDLEVGFGGTDAALGARFATILARNVTETACAIAAVPEVGFLSADGTAQADVATEPDRTGAARVVVPPGEQVLASLTWRAMSGREADMTAALEVVPVPGAEPVVVDVSGPPLGDDLTLDVLDGAEVRVSPWVQAPSRPTDAGPRP